MNWFTTFLAEIIMVPYIGWGIHVLRRRYHHHEDLSLAFEAGTMLGVGVLFILEASLLRVWGTHQPLVYLFALLGLCMATIALYGHVAVSLASRLLVDMVLESDDGDSGQPRFGPAESLERQKDYQGALQEYMVLARVYPGNPTVLCRVGENMVRLERYAEAVPWFERALPLLDRPNRAGAVATRLAGILHRHLDCEDEAREVLNAFIARFPDTPDAQAARAFLAGMVPREEHGVSEQLTALADHQPLPAEPEGESRRQDQDDEQRPESVLTALDTAPIHDPKEEEEAPPPIPAAKPVVTGVVPLETPITDESEVDSWDDLVRDHRDKPRLKLDPLEDAPQERPSGQRRREPSRTDPADPNKAGTR